LSMSKEEREDFLAGPHVAILSLSRGEHEPPLVTPIWYLYEPDGELIAVSGSTSEKTALASRIGRGSVIVQREQIPPKYVAVDVDVRVDPEVNVAERRAIAARYLPPEAIDGFLAMSAEEDAVMLRMIPRRWRTTDLSKVAQ
jgi:hypothetical protein